MNKICTDLEQSNKFIELGIDMNTADFMWEYNPDKETYWNKPTIIPIDNYIFINDIPAWSLSALIGLMPTDDKKDEYYVDTESHSNYHTVSYRNCWDGCIHSEYSEESLLDAAFEMVCWLLENKKV